MINKRLQIPETSSLTQIDKKMSDVRKCPTCGGKAKYRDKDGEATYIKVEDNEAFKKIGQLKKAMTKYKEKAEALEKELQDLKASMG